MKCKDCDCCHEVPVTRPNYIGELARINIYQCLGVKEPFEIPDIDHECYEYPEKRDEKQKPEMPQFEDGFLIGDTRRGIYITPTDIMFIRDGERISAQELLKKGGSDMESEKVVVICCPDCVCKHDAPRCKKTREKVRRAVENGTFVFDSKQMCDICKEEELEENK